MSTAIICAVLILFVFLAIRSYRKQITSGCCGSESNPAPKKIGVHDRNLNHYPYAKVLLIDGMTCQNCVIHIQNELNSIDGVFAKVDLWKKEAVVYMNQDLSDGILRKAVSEAGYTVMSIHDKGYPQNGISAADAKD